MAKHQYLSNRMIAYHHLMAKHCRNSRFDFEILTQSEARELPTSGHESVMEGPRILLIVFIVLYYTYTMAKHQYLSNRMIMIAYHHLMAKHCGNIRFDFEILTQSEARELPTSGHESVMEGPRILLIVFIVLYYTYTMAKHQYLSNRMIAYHHLMAKHCQTAGSISKI